MCAHYWSCLSGTQMLLWENVEWSLLSIHNIQGICPLHWWPGSTFKHLLVLQTLKASRNKWEVSTCSSCSCQRSTKECSRCVSRYRVVYSELVYITHTHTHTHTHQRLMEFLEKVTQHSDTNKMDLTNVAMVIAPSLFVALPVRNNLDDVMMAAKTSHVVRLLIKYHPLLWTVGLVGSSCSPLWTVCMCLVPRCCANLEPSQWKELLHSIDHYKQMVDA